MKKLKLYFYLIYLVFVLFSLFLALKHEDLVLHWSWDPIVTWIGLIKFILKLGGFGLILLVFEIVIENIHLAMKNRKIHELEQEVLGLKAKLYDKGIETFKPIAPTPNNQENEQQDRLEY